MAAERERIGQSSRRRGHDDFRPAKKADWNSRVNLVAADFPSSTNDSACRVIEPGAGAANLDFLSARQPEASLDQRVFQHDGDVLELLVHQCRAREAEGHPDDLTRATIDVNRAHSAWLAIVFGTYSHFVYIEHSIGQPDLQ